MKRFKQDKTICHGLLRRINRTYVLINNHFGGIRMPKFRVYGVVVASKYIGEFEAATKEEAEQMAWDSDESSVSVCWHCSRDVEEPQIDELIIEEVKE